MGRRLKHLGTTKRKEIIQVLEKHRQSQPGSIGSFPAMTENQEATNEEIKTVKLIYLLCSTNIHKPRAGSTSSGPLPLLLHLFLIPATADLPPGPCSSGCHRGPPGEHLQVQGDEGPRGNPLSKEDGSCWVCAAPFLPTSMSPGPPRAMASSGPNARPGSSSFHCTARSFFRPPEGTLPPKLLSHGLCLRRSLLGNPVRIPQMGCTVFLMCIKILNY